MKDKLIKLDWIVNNLIVHNLLKNYLNLKGEFMQLNLIRDSMQKQLLTAVL